MKTIKFSNETKLGAVCYDRLGNKKTVDYNTSFICGADTYYETTKWQRFWRKFGFYKSKFSQSSGLTLPADYVVFGDTLEITATFAPKRISERNFKRMCKEMYRYYKKVNIYPKSMT